MPVTRRRQAVTATVELKKDDIVSIPDSELPPLTEMEVERKKLRQRWELASVLNFLNVFEPVIKSNLKISAEEIEVGLIEPNDSLAQLHIALLKGVVHPSKTLNGPEAWVPILSKKLTMWWPWVAEGDFPLTTARGEEMSGYKELDPTIRLLMLKALCEIRADQDDIVSYINDAIKKGSDLSTFRKEKLGGDGKGTVYWYDGNTITGHRLYKEVCSFELKPKTKCKETKRAINSQWDTLATNLEEFRKVVNEFSSSAIKLEVAVGKVVEADAIPALEKLQKKKQRLMKQQQKQNVLLNGIRTSVLTRSGRARRPVSYRYEEYDRAIKEAIEVTQTRKTTEEIEEKNGKYGRMAENESIEVSPPANSRDSESTKNDTDSEQHQEGDDDHSRSHAYEGSSDGTNKCSNNLDQEIDKTGCENNLVLHFQNLNGWLVHSPNVSCYRGRLAGTDKATVSETVNLAKVETKTYC